LVEEALLIANRIRYGGNRMESKTHDELIELIREALKGKGLFIYRIDKRATPDLIVSNGKILPVEVEKFSTNHDAKIETIRLKSEFPITIIVRPVPKRHVAYDIAQALKESGCSYRQIQQTIKDETGLTIPFGTLAEWLLYNGHPYGYSQKVTNIEIKDR
jgi:hypothetical protein